jgi:hypothetical protein
MYRYLTFIGVTNARIKKLWQNKMPLKIKVFMWLALQDRLQTGMALKAKNGREIIDASCAVPQKM